MTASGRHALRACTAALLAAVLACVAAVLVAVALSYAAPLPRARAAHDRGAHDGTGRATAPRRSTPIVDSTWADHDEAPIVSPPKGGPGYWSNRFHLSVTNPVAHAFDVPDKLLWGARKLGAHPEREAVNVNAFDEVPNSSWFTNRNHVRAVPVSAMRQGPDAPSMPRTPWTITARKSGGSTPGWEIKDADGKKWLVKLDPRGYLQISSGADMVARTLVHAAGYEVPHNEPVRFTRDDLRLDPALRLGPRGAPLYTEADLDSDLAWGARFPDGRYSALASLYIHGKILGSPSMTRRRRGDTNDWYSHTNRRELRGLYVVCSWLGDWDTEDHQFLDSFVATRDTLGHVEHYILDLGSTFGAMSSGPKFHWAGYERGFDLGWIGRRLLTLGFVEEPWRRAHQDTGIPSVGRFESEVYEPQKFKGMSQQPAFRAMTDRDAYWGAKIVASFSNAQIEAAVDAAQYEDPRARDFLVHAIEARRDKVARYWFGRVAPLDFFSIEDGVLRFHDLAVDVGLTPPRTYGVDGVSMAANALALGDPHLRLDEPAVPLERFGDTATRLALTLSIEGSHARPTRVDLLKRSTGWTVTRVVHA